MKVMFMGTPDFAIPTLEALYDKYGVECIITVPDKPKGRKMIMTPTPVALWGDAHNVRVEKPATLKNDAILPLLAEIKPDVIVVVAYGKILPSYVLNFGKYGCINVHGSLLPLYRGAAPMQRAVMDGVKEIGITVMNMDEGLDTGDILIPASIPLDENADFEYVHDTLADLGAKTLIEALEKLEKGEIKPVKQDDEKSTYAAKIEKSDCLIDFNLSCEKIHNTVRGLSPVPLAFSYLKNRIIKIVKTQKTGELSNAEPGEVIETNGTIKVCCGDCRVIEILELVPEGKKKMTSAEFLNGRGASVGDVFTSEKEQEG